jgi:phosphoadenosine phosphosulfate reductase
MAATSANLSSPSAATSPVPTRIPPPALRFADDASPEHVLAGVFEHFAGQRVVVTTAFGLEGCVLLDFLDRLGRPFEVHSVDTGFLFLETHDTRQALERRYPRLTFTRVLPDLAPEEQEIVHGPALWQRDPDLCCDLRKVRPVDRLLEGAAVWVTAVRRSQSATRAATPIVGWDARHGLWKVAPLAAWSRPRALAHALEHGVPINPLHHRGYPSIGCTHCTRPVTGASAGTDSREGRWSGTSKTECGLHLPPPRHPDAPAKTTTARTGGVR